MGGRALIHGLVELFIREMRHHSWWPSEQRKPRAGLLRSWPSGSSCRKTRPLSMTGSWTRCSVLSLQFFLLCSVASSAGFIFYKLLLVRSDAFHIPQNTLLSVLLTAINHRFQYSSNFIFGGSVPQNVRSRRRMLNLLQSWSKTKKRTYIYLSGFLIVNN